jgi:vanillate O-demethylase ferredoxin subunit
MLRRKLLSVHRWAGLSVGLIALVSALTGAGMAFRPYVEHLTAPHLYRSTGCASPLSLDGLAADAARLHPTEKVDFVRVRTGEPVLVRFFNKDSVYLDGCTGALADDNNRYSGWFGTLEYIHRGRWSGIGGWIMGTGAATVIFLLVGLGLYQWWPRPLRRYRQGFSVDKRIKGNARRMALHRAVAGWVALPLLLSATTGIPNAFEWLNDALTGIGARERPEPRSAGTKRTLTLQQAFVIARRETDAPSEVLIHVAPEPGDPIEIYAIEATAPHANARSYLYVDAESGRIIQDTPYDALGPGAKAYYWMLSWHMGELGWWNRIVIFMGAAGAIVLGYTGIGSYLLRKRKKLGADRPRADMAPTKA